MELDATSLRALALLVAEQSAHVLLVVDAALASKSLEFTLFERFALWDAYTIPRASKIGLAQSTHFLAVPYTGIPQLHGAVLGACGSILGAREWGEE